jgi:SAM-dependent methyltransferase
VSRLTPSPSALVGASPERRAGESHLAEIEALFDTVAPEEERWRRRTRSYHRLVESFTRFLVPRNASVLELGCGSGDLLAAVEPSRGVGIDISGAMIEKAADRHPELEFVQAAAEDFARPEQFDYVLLSDLVPFAHDLLAIFDNVAQMTHERSRVVVHSYSQLWRPIIRLAEILRLKPRRPIRNWVSPNDVANVLDLAGFEVVSVSRRILFPVRVPFLSTLLNGFVANVWPLHYLCLSYWVLARPRPQLREEPLTVSVVVPCRNEAGTIAEIVERVPELGASTDLVFVEGGSTDGTRAEIERQIELHPEKSISLFVQTGTGKGDAVRLGFERATGDILVILDADLTVAPEDLAKFYDALVRGTTDLANGSRLVYDLEPGAMQALNVLANKMFSLVFSYLIGQKVKDTLCGTKALFKRDYESIARQRSYFGDLDPFGDFDLILGGARLGLKIVDVPVRYSARSYGRTNISRFRHGWLLLQMAGVAFTKFKVRPVQV